MPAFSAPDGTLLAYRVRGAGAPLICLPGGPMQDAHYLGELGGLSGHRQLIMMDPRGTGASATPRDPASYRCDRLVDDVEALRTHLGLDRVDLLAHCAGANLAGLYVGRHPDRVGRLALITPSTVAVGLAATAEDRRAVALLRKDEPWFPAAFATLESIMAGTAGGDNRTAIDPFFYGRWDAAARAHVADQVGRRNEEAAAVYGAEGAYDPDATRAALAAFDRPVLVLAGEVDLNSVPGVLAAYAGLFPHAEYAVQPAAGHFPWLDDPHGFVETVERFVR